MSFAEDARLESLIGSPEDPTYYGLPVIKKSVWSWTIPLYYYVGGTTGGCAVLGAAAKVLDRDEFPALCARTRWIATGGAVLSGVLLVVDLGKPSRFLNMLRIFRPTSPMSVGSWVITAFSAAAGASLVLPGRIGDIAAVKAGVFGLLLSGYTGVLVSNTVVPVWQRPRRVMPLLFIASAVAGAASFLELFGWNERESATIRTYGVIGKVADLALCQVLEHRVASVPEAAKPLREGWSGALWNAGKILSAVSVVLSISPGTSRKKRAVVGLLGTAGAVCLRFGIHHAGQESAKNPRATFHQQRAGQGAYEVTGKAAVTAYSS